MAKTLDQRVVQLGIDNKQFEKGVDTSLRSIEQLKKGLKFDNASRGLTDVSSAVNKMDFSKMAGAIDNISNRFSVMGAVAFTVISRITNGVIDMAKNAANAIIFDPIKSGLSEYETQINAIQTILANTASKGTTMDDVTSALRELNTYADLTIYNFTEMTRNIGTFTAAGVDLDTSVSAIKGIANLAAVSGSNSQQAATAMYQLSQALSSGTVKLMDWNSVVNAGMGGQVFQDNLKETARVHGIAIDDMIAEQGSFRETLSEGWLTSEILLESLSKFTGDLSKEQIKSMGYTEEQAEEIMKLGEMANDAATKVKTLTQLQDTLKEAMQSGWTQSWELIIGNFDQAKSLFTDISDLLGGAIGESAEARNNMLSLWQQLGGRDILIQAINDAFASLFAIMDTVKEAAGEIFPPMTAGRLLIITQTIGEMVSKFKMAVTNSAPLKKTLKAIFAIIDIGRMLIVGFVKGFVGFLKAFSFVKVFTDIAVNKLLDFIISLRDVIKETKFFDKFFKTVFKGLQIAVNYVVGSILILIGAIQRFVSTKVNLKPIGDWFKQLKLDLIDSGALVGWFRNAFSDIGKWTSSLGPKFEDAKVKVQEIFTNISTGLKDAFGNIDLSKVGDSIKKALSGLFKPGWFKDAIDNFMDYAKKGAAVGGGAIFLGILNQIRLFIKEGKDILGNFNEILEGLGDVLVAYQRNLQADTLQKIAIAIAVLAGAVFVMSLVDPDRLGKAVIALLALFAGLITTMEIFNTMAGGIGKMGSLTIAVVGIAGAVLLLAVALAVISTIEPSQMMAGTLAIAGLLGAVQAFLIASRGGKNMIELGVGMGLLATSLILFAGALALYAMIPFPMVAVGLGNIALALLAIGFATQVMPKNLPILAIGVGLMAMSLTLLAGALYLFSQFNFVQIQVGLTVISALLLIIGISMRLMKNTVEGAASLRIVASALWVLAKVLKKLGSLDPDVVAQGLITLALGIGIIGGLAAILQPVIPAIQALGIALLVMGAALALAGAGMALFAVGVVTLASLTAVGLASLVALIVGVAAVLPFVALKIGEAIVMLLVGIANKSPELLQALLLLLHTGITALTIMIPEIVDMVFTMISTLLQTIADRLPELIEAGTDLIVNFLDGIANAIPRIAEAATNVVITILETIAIEYPKLVDAGFDMLINLVDGITDSVSTQLPRLIQSVRRLGGAIIDGIVAGLSGGESSVFNKVIDLAKTAIEKFKNILGIHSPSKVFYSLSKQIPVSIAKSITRYGGMAVNAVDNLASNVIGGFTNVSQQIVDAMGDADTFAPTITPVMDLSNVESGTSDIQSMIDGTDISLATALQASGAISSGMTPYSVDGQAPDGAQTGTVQYIQNNYSPKALSRYDIYRDTQKQLRFAAKGVLPK